MPKVMPLHQALKFFLVMVLALVVLLAGGALSDRLVTNQSAGLRWLGVAAAVVSLLRNDATARRLGEAAAARVRRDFGWATVTKQFTALCERLAQADRP